jgi:hypothetical protein
LGSISRCLHCWQGKKNEHFFCSFRALPPLCWWWSDWSWQP